MKKIIYSAMLAVVGGFTVMCTSAQEKEIAIVAHRGYWNCDAAGSAKNSIASLKQAQELGVWGSEFDVNMSMDGQLLVFHDNSVEGKRIEKHPASDFEYYRLKNGEQIPTLGQYLEQALKHPETMLVFELKKHSCDSVETKAVDASIAALKEYGLFSPEHVMFISFSKHICKEFAAKAPGFTVQYLEKDADPDELVTFGINGIDTKYKVLLKDSLLFEAARRNNMSINTWTVDKEEDIRKVIELGVDQITTDEPELARQLLKEMGVKEKVAAVK